MIIFLRLFLVAALLLISNRADAVEYSQAESTALLAYARGCMLAQLAGTPKPPAPAFALKQQRACFVTFFNGKKVFACFGGFTPRKPNLAEEIAENVRLALLNDARSKKVNITMVKSAGIQITFPEQPEQVDSYRDIDPISEGMFVEGSTAGVAFVPGEAKTAAWAFKEALRRIGEKDPTATTVYKFKAKAISLRL